MVATDPAAVAVAVVEMVCDGRFAEVEEVFAAPLRAVVSAQTLRVGWESEVARSGAVSALGTPVSEPVKAGLVRVSVPVTCERGGLTVVMSVDEAGLLHGLRLAPALTTQWTPPPYARRRRFDEHEVTVGSGALAVPGTLSVPRGRGPWPGVVLLSGGGPFDRDETSGANKPLKDLAWGLAGRGVAVLRFDKVTCAHAEQVAARADFTMREEYVPHAVAAVHLLQDHPAVDAARVHVAGHSMGGKVAPRVAAAEPSVAGLVLLAGDSQPMHRAAVRVVRYLASLDPGAQAAVETITRQAALVDSPGLSAATPAADLPFGYSGAYWLDLRGYDPVATAAALDKPMLILQGGRDYQVTVADDLAGWREGLAHRPDVDIRVYDADDHLFFPGSGPSTPASYEAPQHVDAAVIADIADWLAPRRPAMARLISRLKR
ncbi:alpha/beta hydrolase family protein [Nonomuraea aurantiaca]|uniref:alpha/beta hydrolase family protein n=1 Tax=Nonomuraea aurantiaca TaxID=2878562 RepID=UPI001CD9E602|nr:alpha/beta hydrolase [Nonomuraea aurantiaca]MCA2226252.1 alpha/beta hydrolase [Nonomuraea aurantiaca]